MNEDYQYQIVMKDLRQFSQIYVVPLSDFHIGCGHTAIDIIQGYIDWIKEHDNAFTILNGDLLNCATKDSTPELFEDLITPDDAYKQLRELLEPIKSKVLMITRGGHEGEIFRKVGHDYMAQLSYDFGNVPYKPDGGMIGIRLGVSNFSSDKPTGHSAMVAAIYATHGWGGARTIGAKVKKVEDLVLAVHADCYVLSHDHTQAVHRLNMLAPTDWRVSIPFLKVKRKLLINTGGFIEYSGYIQRKGYTPQDLGTPRIRIEAKRKRYGRSGTFRRGEEYYLDLHASI